MCCGVSKQQRDWSAHVCPPGCWCAMFMHGGLSSRQAPVHVCVRVFVCVGVCGCWVLGDMLPSAACSVAGWLSYPPLLCGLLSAAVQQISVLTAYAALLSHMLLQRTRHVLAGACVCAPSCDLCGCLCSSIYYSDGGWWALKKSRLADHRGGALPVMCAGTPWVCRCLLWQGSARR